MKKKTVLIILLPLVLLLLAAAIVVWSRIAACEKSCQFSMNSDLEDLSEIEGSIIAKIADGEYQVRGKLLSLETQGSLSTFTFRDYANPIEVNGNIASYSFTLDVPSSLASKVETLKTENNGQLVTLDIKYSQKQLSISDRLKFFYEKFQKGPAGGIIDISQQYELTEFNYSFLYSDEVKSSCDLISDHTNITSTVTLLRNSIVNTLESYDSSSNQAGKFMTIGQIRCNTCNESCELGGVNSVGLDYVFLPMLDYTLTEAGQTIEQENLSLDILGSSYGVDSYENFWEYQQSSVGSINNKENDVWWGSEPICMPYLLEKVANGTSNPIYKKPCFDLGLKYEDNQVSTNLEDFDFSDDVFFSYANTLFSDAEAFANLELMQDKKPIALFVNHAVDNYVYGYESNKEIYVRYANQKLLTALWDLQEEYSTRGNTLAAGYYARETINALLVKKYYVKGTAAEAQVNDLIEKVVAFIGGDTNLAYLFDVDAQYSFPMVDVDIMYQGSLGDVLRVWLLDPDFYSRHFTVAIDDVVQNWFYYHFLSSECGRQNKDIFYEENTDGECSLKSISVVKNLVNSIYLLILNAE